MPVCAALAWRSSWGWHRPRLRSSYCRWLSKARIRDGLPEVDLEAVREVKPDASDLGKKLGELRLGYACAGVPHVVVEISDIESADVTGRGPELRNHPALAEGANVNFVSRRPDGSFTYRTYERGVEGETLACGTGAVATAILSIIGESARKPPLDPSELRDWTLPSMAPPSRRRVRRTDRVEGSIREMG